MCAVSKDADGEEYFLFVTVVVKTTIMFIVVVMVTSLNEERDFLVQDCKRCRSNWI